MLERGSAHVRDIIASAELPSLITKRKKKIKENGWINKRKVYMGRVKEREMDGGREGE